MLIGRLPLASIDRLSNEFAFGGGVKLLGRIEESIVRSDMTELSVSIDCRRASAVCLPLVEVEYVEAIECRLSRGSKSAHEPFEKPVANDCAMLLSEASEVRHDDLRDSPALEKLEKATDDVLDDDECVGVLSGCSSIRAD